MIYTLGPPRNPRLKREYAETPEQIRQLAIDRYWGTTCQPPELEVVVDMFALLVTVRDPTLLEASVEEGRTTYKILEYERFVR